MVKILLSISEYTDRIHKYLVKRTSFFFYKESFGRRYIVLILLQKLRCKKQSFFFFLVKVPKRQIIRNIA